MRILHLQRKKRNKLHKKCHKISKNIFKVKEIAQREARVYKPLAKKKLFFWTKSLRVAGKMNIWAMLVQSSSWLFYKPLNASSEN